MSENAQSDTRDRLLAATERLIYRDGIGATGMDAIVKSSGVARKSIYRYFSTKNALVAEALRVRDERWMAWFVRETNRADTPQARLIAVFSVLEQWFGSSDFRGCAFVNAFGEIGDAADPALAVARAHKRKLEDFLRQLADECGVADPDELAVQWLILIDGAITVALVSGNSNAARSACNIARKLLEQ